MNLRWLWLDLVPPELRITLPERAALRRRIGRVTMTPKERRRHLWWTLGLTTGATAGFILLAAVLHELNIRPILILPLWLPLVWIALAAMVTINNRRRVFLALRDLGYDVCTSCGYWLRGLADDVKHCPECGAPRKANSESHHETHA